MHHYSFNTTDLQNPFFTDETDKIALRDSIGEIVLMFSKARGVYSLSKESATLTITGNGVHVIITSNDNDLIDSEFVNFYKWTNEAMPITGGGGGGGGDATAANQLLQITAEQSIDSKLTTLVAIQTNNTQVVGRRSTQRGYLLLTNVLASIVGAAARINSLTITNPNAATRHVKIYSKSGGPPPLINSATDLLMSVLIAANSTLHLNFDSPLQIAVSDSLFVGAVAGTAETDATSPGVPLRLTYSIN